MLQASASVQPAARGRVKDEMTSHFQRLQNSVLTVWSETGHGTGVIVDPKGLIVTNHHVVGPSDYIAVQFDEKRKIAAVRLEADRPPRRPASGGRFPARRRAPLPRTTPPVVATGARDPPGKLAEVEDFLEFLLQKDEDNRLREAALKHPPRPLPSTNQSGSGGLGSRDPPPWGGPDRWVRPPLNYA